MSDQQLEPARVRPYRPFEPFAQWLVVPHSATQWTDRHDEIKALAGGNGPLLDEAVAVAKRAAAFETGAIEGLYASTRGITLSIATSAAVFSAAIEKEKAKNLIEAQLDAYDHVLDFATRREPLIEAWFRQLHSVVCKAQDTYTVHDPDGTPRQEILPKGEYKTRPNNVLQRDGWLHTYAEPGTVTESEMQRLFAELRGKEFEQANPCLQAAYAHHALVAVHPFADGNGRMARVLASVFTYRAISTPLLLFSDSRDEYFEALADADNGKFEPFIDLTFRSGLTTLGLVTQSLRTAQRPTPMRAVSSLGGMGLTRGGYGHYEVDRTAQTVIEEVNRLMQEKAAEISAADRNMTWEVRVKDGIGVGNAQAGYRSPKLCDDRITTCTMIYSQPGLDQTILNFYFRAFVPNDCLRDGQLLLRCEDLRMSKNVEVRLLLEGRVSTSAQMDLSMWLDEVVSVGIAKLSEQVKKKLMEKGVVLPPSQ